MNDQPLVVGIGEVLWDLLPGGKQLGGAPANLVYHAAGLGARGFIVSRIGQDALGEELTGFLDRQGLSRGWITRDGAHPTGTVSVTLEADGKPRYVIHRDVAWDFIPDTPAALTLAGGAPAVCFGSLGQRAPVSRATIRRFVAAAPPDAWRVFDINLRQSFFDRDVIDSSLRLANVLKISDEELPVVARLLNTPADPDAGLIELSRRYSLKMIALTLGAHGSVLYDGRQFYRQAGMPVKVIDTVGAGDAFTAALIMGLLRGLPPPQTNAWANRLASYVCSQAGAMPPIPADLRQPA